MPVHRPESLARKEQYIFLSEREQTQIPTVLRVYTGDLEPFSGPDGVRWEMPINPGPGSMPFPLRGPC